MKKNATEGSDDSAETKALQAQIAELTEALASQAKDLAAKDDALAKQAETITALRQLGSPSSAAACRTLPDDLASTDCEARARKLLATTARLSGPIKEGLVRCLALRASLPIKRGEVAVALQAERAQIVRDVTRAVDNGLANQLFHVDTSIRRMRHSIDLQQMPLQNMMKQVDDAAALATAAISSAEIASFGSRLDATARNMQLANTDRALPNIDDAIYEMEATMRFAVDSTAWPRVRRSAMLAVERHVAGIVTAHCGNHPILEILQKSNVMRRIMALIAPTRVSGRAERQQWASKVLALEPVMHRLPIVVSVAALTAGSAPASDAPNGAAAASSAAKTATQSLSLANVVAKDFLENCTSFTAPGVKWADEVNPWLAMAAMYERCVRVTLKGHSGKWAGVMGVYKLNEEHSAEGKDVFTNVLLSGAVHLFRAATNGKWYIGCTKDMVAEKDFGKIASSTASESFLNLKWQFWGKHRGLNPSSTWQDDPFLNVTDTTAGADHEDPLLPTK